MASAHFALQNYEKIIIYANFSTFFSKKINISIGFVCILALKNGKKKFIFLRICKICCTFAAAKV